MERNCEVVMAAPVLQGQHLAHNLHQKVGFAGFLVTLHQCALHKSVVLVSVHAVLTNVYEMRPLC